jgi:hypothetical protein
MYRHINLDILAVDVFLDPDNRSETSQIKRAVYQLRDIRLQKVHHLLAEPDIYVYTICDIRHQKVTTILQNLRVRVSGFGFRGLCFMFHVSWLMGLKRDLP